MTERSAALRLPLLQGHDVEEHLLPVAPGTAGETGRPDRVRDLESRLEVIQRLRVSAAFHRGEPSDALQLCLIAKPGFLSVGLGGTRLRRSPKLGDGDGQVRALQK
jgi:hypothetical protein